MAVALWIICGLTSACTATIDPDPNAPSTAATLPTATSVSIVPVTPDGMITGPGITDSSITLGLLVDPERDRGFTDGVQLWRNSVNASGGLCGRSVQLMSNGSAGVPADALAAYDYVGRSTLGLITLPAVEQAASLNARIVADQIPALTPSGTSAQLGPSRAIVVGATDDILTINALDYLSQTGRIAGQDTVGVLTDLSASAANGLTGAQWWAQQHGVTLDVRIVRPGVASPKWDGVRTVVALADAPTVGRLAAAAPSTTTIVTTTDGYDPARWDKAALAVATAGRVLVSTPTPVIGSDYPATAVVTAAFTHAGGTDPGPRLLAGYATAATWTRLLTQACTDRSLTRSAVEQAATTIGASSAESLFGPTDPGQAVESGLPATRVSAMATADPSVPSGLTPLTGLESASDIESYQP